jgi:hypothetical protein
MRTQDANGCGLKVVPCAFRPAAGAACVVDTRVRARFADSLSAALKSIADDSYRCRDLIARLRAGPVAPAIFASYTELVEAIFRDDVDTARNIAAKMSATDFGSVSALRIVTLGDSYLGCGQTVRYRRLVDEDPALGVELKALTPSELAAGAEWVGKALSLLEKAAPEVAGEFEALMREVVLVDRADTTFSATSFQLWGALFMKINRDTTRVEIAEALAHETAHALLFGSSMGKPLVENLTEELYTSPMRGDQRPMDHVVHATYVIARMHYTVSRLLGCGLLTDEEQRAARDARKRHENYFRKGLSEVAPHARWTPEGEAAFASASEYMESV